MNLISDFQWKKSTGSETTCQAGVLTWCLFTGRGSLALLVGTGAHRRSSLAMLSHADVTAVPSASGPRYNLNKVTGVWHESDQVHVWQCLSSLAPSIKGQSFHLLSFFSHILSRTHLPISSSVYGSQLLYIFLSSWPENRPSGFHTGVHGESGKLLKSVWVMHVKLLYELK